MAETQQQTPTTGPDRPGSITYIQIPATDVRGSADFYAQVFGWNIRGGSDDHYSFDDANAHLIGAWVTDRAVSRDPGVLPYIYVAKIDDTVAKITAHGGEIVRAPYAEGSLRVGTFRDPAGNVIGIWQMGPR